MSVGVHNKLHISSAGWWDMFTSRGIDTRQKRPTAFSVSSERHCQSGVNGIAKVSKRSSHLDSQPGRPTHCSRAIPCRSEIVNKCNPGIMQWDLCIDLAVEPGTRPCGILTKFHRSVRSHQNSCTAKWLLYCWL